MSNCLFIAADCPLPVYDPPVPYPVVINTKENTFTDGDADDNYSLWHFREAADYTELPHAVELVWRYTPGRAERVIEVIKSALRESGTVELWKVWLRDYYEFDERPMIRVKEIGIGGLSAETLRTLDEFDPWKNRNSIRPTFLCVRIVREM